MKGYFKGKFRILMHQSPPVHLRCLRRPQCASTLGSRSD